MAGDNRVTGDNKLIEDASREEWVVSYEESGNDKGLLTADQKSAFLFISKVNDAQERTHES